MTIRSLITFFALLPIFVNGQDYLPILNSEQTWIGRDNPGTAPSSSYQYTYSEDSVSQLTNYYFERIQSNKEDGSDPYIQGYYREIDGMIYEKLEGNFNERLVLDMSLMEGDTFAIDQNVSNELIVTKVDTVSYDDGVPRKRIELQCTENPDFFGSFFWVEGIGEFFFSTPCQLDGGEFLTCVLNIDGETIYHTELVDNCWITTSTNDQVLISPIISPNPAMDVLYIENHDMFDHLEIRNMLGQMVIRESSLLEVDISDLDDGSYIITFYANGSSVSRKVVKL